MSVVPLQIESSRLDMSYAAPDDENDDRVALNSMDIQQPSARSRIKATCCRCGLGLEGTSVGQFCARQKQTRCCRCCCCFTSCLLVILLICIILSVVRRNRRIKMLDPLLDALERSPFCNEDGIITCVLNVGLAGDKFQLHPAENPLFGFLYGQLLHQNSVHLKDALFGAYVLFPDPDRRYYRFLSTLPDAHKRISSHQSSSIQYGIPEGQYLSAILIGTIDCPSNAGAPANSPCTWLQFEGSEWQPLRDPVGAVGHSLDYLRHLACGCNIGPLGQSNYTDHTPLVVSGKIANRSEVCPLECDAISVSSDRTAI
eukprot:gnl/MRDRNA2_/MRDRNA2_162855_c0_seq1.p1 gnl/MRDRNA2_/MRDRNA2_162855_c0~~gnl/MRDRNA2_/MRDRNA2_162855_c0_seq1.p1  ORF type:complete len:324 (+),score=12.79 gnl/MRDRNA2_/MRDRNA2_162855_c0_seq1:33-974(+)